jgi:uncharacterized membrane protein YtjA (UPF0391 family)
VIVHAVPEFAGNERSRDQQGMRGDGSAPGYRYREQSPRARHYSGTCNTDGRHLLLELIVTLLIIGLIAAVLGFGGIAGASFAMAKVIFFIVLVLFLISIVFGTMRRPI